MEHWVLSNFKSISFSQNGEELEHKLFEIGSNRNVSYKHKQPVSKAQHIQ